MANSLYDKVRPAFALAQINWATDNIKVAVLGPTYTGGTVATQNDEFYSSIAAHTLVGTTPIRSLTNKVTSMGVSPNIIYGALSANPVTFVALTANQTIGYLVIFKDPDVNNIDGPPALGNQGSAQLIALMDSGYGIGAGTNGQNIQITWDLTNGIMRL